MFENRNFFGPMASYLIIYKKPQNTMKFKRRHGEFEQRCVMSKRYTATDALPPILPACRQPLLPTCVFVTRDSVRHPRRFLFGKFVREPICSWWEAFVNRGLDGCGKFRHPNGIWSPDHPARGESVAFLNPYQTTGDIVVLYILIFTAIGATILVLCYEYFENHLVWKHL
jgi:hypothetical protein